MLRDATGPDTWQRECLEELGAEVRARAFDGVQAVAPIRASAWLAPAPIPLCFVEPGAADLGDEVEAALNGEPGRGRALLVPLARYSLIRRGRDGQTYWIHRLVAEVMRDRLGAQASEGQDRALLASADSWPSVGVRGLAAMQSAAATRAAPLDHHACGHLGGETGVSSPAEPVRVLPGCAAAVWGSRAAACPRAGGVRADRQRATWNAPTTSERWSISVSLRGEPRSSDAPRRSSPHSTRLRESTWFAGADGGDSRVSQRR